jgi:hypothetical protein
VTETRTHYTTTDDPLLSHAVPAAVPGVGERGAFEAWVRRFPFVDAYALLINASGEANEGEYADYRVEICWLAWQARASLSAAPGLPAPGQPLVGDGLPRTGTASLSDVEHRGGEKP